MNDYTGVWRSLVARLTGGQEAAGSSPVTPRKGETVKISGFPFVLAIIRGFVFSKILPIWDIFYQYCGENITRISHEITQKKNLSCRDTHG